MQSLRVTHTPDGDLQKVENLLTSEVMAGQQVSATSLLDTNWTLARSPGIAGRYTWAPAASSGGPGAQPYAPGSKC